MKVVGEEEREKRRENITIIVIKVVVPVLF
jgi:hypothetical protein